MSALRIMSFGRLGSRPQARRALPGNLPVGLGRGAGFGPAAPLFVGRVAP